MKIPTDSSGSTYRRENPSLTSHNANAMPSLRNSIDDLENYWGSKHRSKSMRLLNAYCCTSKLNLSGAEWPDSANITANSLLGFPQIYSPLCVQPKFRTVAEKAR